MKARVLLAIGALSFVAPAIATGQGAGIGVSLQGTIGTQINAPGNNQSISIGFSPNERLDLLIGAERIHLSTEVTRFGATRGGTTTFVSGEVRLSPVTINGFSPYLLGGLGAGRSRPNVNDLFPNAVTNSVWLIFGGGGVRFSVTDRFSVFADLRAGMQGERDSIFLLLPVRGGVAWRF
jgi:hypothetical protein